MPKLELKVDIDAPVEAVWAVLTDFAGHEQWNPLHSIEGQAAAGASILLHSKAPGGRAVRSRGLVWEFAPNAKLELLTGNPLLYSSKRYFHLAPHQDRTELRHGVVISGIWALWLFSTQRHKIERLRPMQEAFASALIRRVSGKPSERPHSANRRARRSAKSNSSRK